MSHKDTLKGLLKEFMAIEAMSRYEGPVADAMIKNTRSENLKYSKDGFGSLIIERKNNEEQQPRIMISAHMDEVGYIVRNIDDNGQLYVASVGGVWPSVVIGTRARVVVNSSNKEINGIFGHTSIHIMEAEKRTKAITNKELYVDCGFMSKKEAVEFGIEAGDRVYMTGETIEFPHNDLIAGKAMDNRAGVTIVTLLAKEIANMKLPNNPIIVGSAQEEVGTRGAKTSVGLINPDIAIAIDTSASHDTIGAVKGGTKLGDGVAILVNDMETAMDPRLVDNFMHLAKEKGIKAYKYVAEGGGTDAAELQYGRGGVPTITLSIPQRYLHSPIGMCSMFDIEQTFLLILEFLKSFDKTAWNKIKNF